MPTLALAPTPTPQPKCRSSQNDLQRWMNIHRCITQPHHDWHLQPGMAQLRRWPDLAEVPEPFLLPVSRLCALLSRSAILIHRIPELLGDDHSETHAAFQILKAFGYIEVIASPAQQPGHPGRQPVRGAPDASAQHSTSDRIRTLIQHLRKQLLG